MGGGVSARIPLAVLADATGTLPKVDAPLPAAAPLTKFTADDRATRLADVILLWNVLQHFYPYFDVVKTDWPAVLPAALKSAATDANETAFLRTLRTMMAELHDGHGQIYSSAEARGWSLPLLFGWIDDKLVVTHTTDASSELRPGEVIERIDGKPAKQALGDEEALVSAATPQYRRWTALQRLRSGAKDSEVKLDVRRGEETKSIAVRRSVESSTVDETRPAKIAELEPRVFYVDLGRITDADFNGALETLAAARGVIFDLRGYPSCGPDFLTHLIDAPIQSARWNVPIVTRPDHGPVDEYDTAGRWTLSPKAPRLRGKIVFLTDGRAISYAESIMGIIEAYKLAAIVGEPTAGTNGNINPLELPGGYRVFWTGMKVLKHDGSQHHGVGIQPTVRVSPTLRGVAEKRDEQLEAAVRIAKGD
jgi:C-terminal processing protease CtpA/Prc